MNDLDDLLYAFRDGLALILIGACLGFVIGFSLAVVLGLF